MAFEVFQSGRAPEHTTVRGYSIDRLGVSPEITSTFTETVDERLKVLVTSAVDDNGDGVFEVLTINLGYGAEQLPLVGTPVETDNVIIGYINAVEALPVENFLQRAKLTLTGGLSSADSVVVTIRRTNKIGNTSHVPSAVGREWSIKLSTERPSDLSIIEQMMIKIMVATLKVACAEMGIVKTDGELAGCAMVLASQGITIDSLITDEMESLEKTRRAGNIAVTTTGNLPGSF